MTNPTVIAGELFKLGILFKRLFIGYKPRIYDIFFRFLGFRFLYKFRMLNLGKKILKYLTSLDFLIGRVALCHP